MRALYIRIHKKRGHNIAVVAVARKLVILANTLIAEDRTWTPIPPKHA